MEGRQHLLLSLRGLAQTRYGDSLHRVDELDAQQIRRAELVDAGRQQDADSPVAQADLATHFAVHAGVQGLLHEPQGVLDPLPGHYIDKARVAELSDQGGLECAIKERLAGAIVESGDEHPIPFFKGEGPDRPIGPPRIPPDDGESREEDRHTSCLGGSEAEPFRSGSWRFSQDWSSVHRDGSLSFSTTRLRPPALFDLCNELIPPASASSDQSLRIAVVAECVSYLADGSGEGGFADFCVRPDLVEEFRLGHDSVAVFYEVEKQSRGFELKVRGRARAEQLTASGPQLEVLENEDAA